MIVSNDLINAGLMLIPVGMAFSKAIRYEMLRRDKWTCQNDNCLGTYLDLGRLNWGRGYNVNAAHYPEMHQKQEDKDISHGRCLCVHCHIIEEIERGNHSGAGLLYEKQTIMNKEWLAEHGWVDQKPPIFWYYDWVKADDLGKEGLSLAYKEMFNLIPPTIYNLPFE